MRLKSLSTALLAFTTSTQAADFDIDNLSYDLNSGYDHQSYSLNIDTSINPFYLSFNDNIETNPEVEQPLPLYLQVQPEKDWQYLKEQTYTILGLSVATVGLMTLLPESITKWDAEARDMSKLGKKWVDNVSQGLSGTATNISLTTSCTLISVVFTTPLPDTLDSMSLSRTSTR